MKTQTVLVFFIVTVMATMVTSQGEVYCGRRLASALALLCDYNLLKRSQSQYTPMQGVDVMWPWIAPHRAHSMGRTKRHGVVTECCDKPCTMDELMSYCGN